MSTNAQLPTKDQAEQAYAYQAKEVHTPAFFQKLASHGIRPRTHAESAQLLEMGAVLAQKEEAGQYKTAANAIDETENPFLTHALNELTGGPQLSPNALDSQIFKSAAELVTDNPVARNAALIFGHLANGGQLAPAAAPPAKTAAETPAQPAK